MVLCCDCTKSLQLGTHGLIDLTARCVVGRHDDSVFWIGRVAFRNRRNALLCIGNLGDTALLFQEDDSLRNLAARKMLDGF